MRRKKSRLAYAKFKLIKRFKGSYCPFLPMQDIRNLWSVEAVPGLTLKTGLFDWLLLTWEVELSV